MIMRNQEIQAQRPFVAFNKKLIANRLFLFERLDDVSKFGFNINKVKRCLERKQKFHQNYSFEYVTPSEYHDYLDLAKTTSLVNHIQ